jgi:hypothetical protein
MATWTTSTVASAFEARYAAVKLRLEAFFIPSKENPKFTNFTVIETNSDWPTNSGFEVDSKTTNSNGLYPAWKAFNKLTTDDDCWHSTNSTPSTANPEWLRIKFDSPVVINKYSISGRPLEVTSSTSAVWFPTRWVLQGSINGVDNWTALEPYRTTTTWDKTEVKTYDTGINTAGTAYLSYRLLIEGARLTNDDSLNRNVCIGEWRLFTKAFP